MLELGRTPAGALTVNPPLSDLIGQGLMALATFLFCVVAVLMGSIDRELTSARLAVEIGFGLLAMFVTLGIWFARRKHLKFDSRARVVERGGVRVCGYQEVKELVIDLIHPGSDVIYRLELRLGDNRTIWVGEARNDADNANDAARRIASETGVSVRVLR